VVGGGHNGLVAAGYLAKAGRSVAVLEKREVLGGAAVTEEIVPGFKFSRASYLLSLLRPQIVKDLDLKSHGLKVYLRNPNAFAPLLDSDQYLLLGTDAEENRRQIAKFSQRDAERYDVYEQWMEKIADAITPLLDSSPVNFHQLFSGSLHERLGSLKSLRSILRMGSHMKDEMAAFYELMSAPASKISSSYSTAFSE
jgi:phytoene dehydrogenase-like protein